MGNIAKRADGSWRARYRDAAGRERSRHFRRRIDAQRWLNETGASILEGRYIDPNAGRIKFRDYADEWRSQQIHRPTTAAQVEGVLTRLVFPHFGDRPIGTILPSDIQSWVKKLSLTLQPSTVGVAHRIVSGIFKSAIADRRITANPCTGTRLPKISKRLIHPILVEQLANILRHYPPRHRALMVMAAGTGLRQGEIFGLTVDRLDLERRDVLVDRQLINVNGREPSSAAQVPGQRPHRSATGRRRRRAPRRTSRPTPATALVFTNNVGAAAASVSLLDRVEPRPQAGRHPSIRLPRAAALLRLTADPSWGVRQDRPGPARARQRQPKRSTPTATSGPTPTSGRRTPSTEFSEILRTICGPTEATRKTSPQVRGLKVDESADTPGSVPRRSLPAVR